MLKCFWSAENGKLQTNEKTVICVYGDCKSENTNMIYYIFDQENLREIGYEKPPGWQHYYQKYI